MPFSLAAFLCVFNLCCLIMMCLAVGLFGFIFIETLCISWVYMTLSFIRLWEFSDIILSNRFSSLMSLFSYWYPNNVNVDTLDITPVASYNILTRIILLRLRHLRGKKIVDHGREYLKTQNA